MKYTQIAKIFAKTLIQETGDCFARVATLARNDGGKRLLGHARNFVKYHNAFTIMMVVMIVATGSVMASEPAQEMLAEIVGEEKVVETGIDNTTLLDTSLDEFDLEMTINAVSEDTQNYYVDYSYNTLGIMDNVWQGLFRENIMKVSKLGLGKNIDLGLYLTEELGEIADCELVFLRQMQEKETEKGETQIVETTEYSGLIGLVLDVKNKVLPDYEPVIHPEIIVPEQQLAAVVPVAPTPDPPPDPEPPLSDTFDPIFGCTDEIALNYNPSATQNDDSCEYPPVVVLGCMDSTATNYNLEATEDNQTCEYPPAEPLICESFTYSEWGECSSDGTQTRTVLTSLPDNCVDGSPVVSQTCEYLPEPDPDPPADPVCDTNNIDLCVSQELCETAELYWYADEGSQSCHCEERPAGSDEAISSDPPTDPDPILGCTDSTALNYSSDATEDDNSCQYPPPTCVNFTYSDYTECSLDGTQTRTILTSSPENCENGTSILSQPCEYTPAPDPLPADSPSESDPPTDPED